MYITIHMNDGNIMTKETNCKFSEIVYKYLSGTNPQVESIDFQNLYITSDWGRYQILTAYRVPKEEIEEHLLIYPIRYKKHLVEPSELFEKVVAHESKPYLIDSDSAFMEYSDYTTLNNHYKNNKITTY